MNNKKVNSTENNKQTPNNENINIEIKEDKLIEKINKVINKKKSKEIDVNKLKQKIEKKNKDIEKIKKIIDKITSLNFSHSAIIFKYSMLTFISTILSSSFFP